MSYPWVKLVLPVFAIAGALLVTVWLFQRRLIYLPLEQDVPPPGVLLPLASSVRFPTADGIELAAWFVPAATERTRGTVLVLHGNAGNRAMRAPLALELGRRGFSVLLTDYRGFGGNPGRPSESGLALDARAALAYLRSRDDVQADRILYFGESLGAALAIELATEHPPALLVLRSPFTSLVDVARVHYPFLPVSWLLTERYPSIERMPLLECPLMVIAGDADRVVPFEQSRRLFETAAELPRRWVALDGVGHNDREMLDGLEMLDALDMFWDDLQTGSGRKTRPPDQETR